MSRRVMKATATETNEYLYDGWNMIREISHTPIPPYSHTNSYVWGLDLSQSLQGAGGIGGLLSVTKHEAQSTKHYALAYDANGNVTELVDTNGAIAAHYEYDPYGNLLAQSGPLAGSNPYRFSTKYQDDETGLLYYGYRFYSPQLGRWLSRDPLMEKSFQLVGRRRARQQDEALLYAFVRNRPLNDYDLMGLQGRNDVCCHVESTDLCYCACKVFAPRNPIYSGHPGATVCYRGTKCMCLWGHNYPFSFDPNSRAAACLEAHERYHYDNSGACPAHDPGMGDTVTPPPGPARECDAYAAQTRCLEDIPPGSRDATWTGMDEHVRRRREALGCP